MDDSTHSMNLSSTNEDGSEVWVCPTCGRTISITWPPNYHRVVLVVGDEDAIHEGGTGGVQMSASATDSGSNFLPFSWEFWEDVNADIHVQSQTLPTPDPSGPKFQKKMETVEKIEHIRMFLKQNILQIAAAGIFLILVVIFVLQ